MDELFYFPVYFGFLILLSPLFGYFMAYLLNAKSLPGESWILSFLFSGAPKEQTSKEYLKSLFTFHLLLGVFSFLILRFQNRLPLNPIHLPGMNWDLALNTCISFLTNTNWQAYSGESQLSYFSQMVGLAPLNFLSAGVGLSVLMFVGRAISASSESVFGNFWRDLYRSVFYILLPLSVIIAFLLVGEGVVQTFLDPVVINGISGNVQTIPLGPVASQVAIKQLGTNGGGFYGVNSAHPLENPTPISNFIQLFAILLLPGSCVFLYGKLVGSFRHAWTIFFVMLLSITLAFTGAYLSENTGASAWEGKETRFNLVESTLWMTATTAASNGSVNSMHDSFSPLAGGIGLFQIMLGEVIFGGVGAGMYGMFLFLILTVFLSGLMTGRTPEYLGKKIGKFEIKWTLVGILAPTFCILIGTVVSIFLKSGYSAHGPHALSQILYAFSSASNNNGSAFAGFSADTLWGNLSLGFSMLIGRFVVIASVIFVSSSLGKKIKAEASEGNFKTDTALFGILLLSILLLVCGLSFFPVIVLGPIFEHILMLNGDLF
ncbi:potassium-transporting ATPase subunit A [Leptospira ognonensis]|uniref:Potassium-transporting ATPase potassium-binding subunit n=1 Tax=Leptospira ognonensis TaxID=2484945 RepID=A0A4R9KB40_9LEPT|nr:potassium-transporting ATPase subunit KdpA [Leptospira ognonensis]TGL63924.1 potassium-transporting ATPase subunit A [Leptospira ognonensis]